MWLGALLPLGVVGQAVLGGFTVKGALDYGWVMGHFALSMLILRRRRDARVARLRRAEPGATQPQAAPTDRTLVRARARRSSALGALTIFAGTAATAAGPHAGGSPGQKINRLDFDGRGTMDFVIHRHAEIALVFSLAAVRVWWLARRRAVAPGVQRPLTVLCVLLALQGVVGLDQYETHLPTELVWVHVALPAAPGWRLLWAACAAGSLAPSAAPRRRPSAPAEAPLRARRAAQVPRKLGLLRGRSRAHLSASSSSPAVSLLAATTLEKGVA